MPEYAQLHDDVDEVGFVVNNKTVAMKVGLALKKLAPYVGKVGDKWIGVPLIGTVTGIVSAVKTGSHIAGLKTLKKGASVSCTCGDCVSYIDYAIGKKSWKMGKKCVGLVPIVGTATTVGFKAKGAWKAGISKNRGENRKIVATGIWLAMRGETDDGEQCQTAKSIVGELCGKSKINTILNSATGNVEIFKKLASA